MSKKRKEAPTVPSSTLFDYFSSGASRQSLLNGNFKRRNTSATATSSRLTLANGISVGENSNTSKYKGKQPSKKEVNSRNVTKEVIIIDSDTEECEGKRKEEYTTHSVIGSVKVEEEDEEEVDSSDVEILEGPGKTVDVVPPTDELTVKHEPDEGEELLKCSKDCSKGSTSSSDSRGKSKDSSGEGISESLPTAFSAEGLTNLSGENANDWETTLLADIPDSPGLVGVKEEFDGAIELDDSDNSNREETEDGFESCPICGIAFIDADVEEIQLHINNCIDLPTVTATTSSKTLEQTSSRSHLLQPSSSSSTASQTRSSSSSPPPPTVASSPKTPIQPPKQPNSAFSFLMSNKAAKERAIWAEAQAAETRNTRTTKNSRRNAPFYKVLTGMPIAVDAFRYGRIPGVTSYFLTHAHSDHYTNLSSSWKEGYIYCSETTANLIMHMLSVDKKWIRPLPMDTPIEVPDSGGVKVTLIDANHCPGSCLFLFEGLQTVNAGDSTYKSPHVGTARMFRYLHCGDFRACPRHILHPSISGKVIDVVYLDTTYLNPKYCFPPQPLVVDACAELARRIVRGESLEGSGGDGVGSKGGLKNMISGWVKKEEGKGKGKSKQDGNTLVVVGTYSIGKERVVKAIAKVLNTKVYCDARKTAILRCEEDPELHSLLTKNPLEAGVHVAPLNAVTSDRLKDYMVKWSDHWTSAVAFRPTGWTYSQPTGSDPNPPISRIISTAQSRTFSHTALSPGRNSTSAYKHYGVPYSEHSSFAELTCFAVSLQWRRVIATVNVGSRTGRDKMQKWIEKWESERKRRRDAGESEVVEYRSLDYW